MKVTTRACSAMMAAFLCLAAVPAHAGTSTETYDRLQATISAPDSVKTNTDFSVYVDGAILGGGSFDVFAYSLYEDADWYYDSNHMVVVTSGTLIDADGFNFGCAYTNTYSLNKPAGTYKYTFIFGFRSSGHGWYDLAVEVHVIAEDDGPALTVNTSVLSAGGGKVDLTLDAGASHAFRDYVLLGSAAGTAPGTVLPGGGVLPLNRDFLLDYILRHLNGPSFTNFLGTLDASGEAAATLDTLGPLPPVVPSGTTLHFAFTALYPFDFQSNAVEILIVD